MKKLKQRALEKMLGYAGNVIELTGNNDHPIIDKAQTFLGIGQDEPYCEAIASWAKAVALGERLGVDVNDMAQMKKIVKPKLVALTPISSHGSCTDEMTLAMQRGVWIPRERAGDAEPGDCVIFDFTKPGGKLSRHYGMLIEKPSGGVLRTVEGNTSPDHDLPVESNDARKNGGVWLKKRSMVTRVGYKVLGFVRGPE